MPKQIKLVWEKQKEGEKVAIYIKLDNGSYREIKRISGKQNNCIIQLTPYANYQKCCFKIRSYYEKDGVRIWSKYSKEIPLKKSK